MNRFTIDGESRVRLLLSVAAALGAVYLGFLALSTDGVIRALKWFGIPLILIAVLLFGFHGVGLFQRYRSQILSLYRNKAFAIAFPIASLFLFANQPIGYKTVMDEILLSGTARQIFAHSEPFVATEAIPEQDGLRIIHSYVDKRALFFPTLVALVHHASGYRPENPFYLNIALTLALLAILWGVGYRLARAPGGVLGLLLAVSLPLLALSGTSGGFEMLNLLFIAILFLAIYAVFLEPDTRSLSFLVATTVLLAQIRYESVIFILPTAVVIISTWLSHRRLILPVTLILAAPLLLNVAWQSEIFETNPQAYQLESKPEKESVFSLSYVPENLGHALYFFVSSHQSMPNSLLLFLAGFPALIYALLRLRTWLASGETDTFHRAVAIMILALLLHFGLMMAYFWGQYDDPIIFRLSLPTWLLFWFAVMVTAAPLLHRPRIANGLLATFALFFALTSLPILANHSYAVNHWASANFEAAREWSDSQSDKRFLFITVYGMFWIVEGHASIKPEYLRDRAGILRDYLDTNSFDEILVFRFTAEEDTPKPEGVPESAFVLPEGLITEPYYERNQPLRGGIEIRRVVGLEPELLKAAAQANGEMIDEAGTKIETEEPLR